MKEFFQTLYRLYNLRIILFFIVLFLAIQIPSFQVFPDIFNLNAERSPDSYILRLLSIVIGFSSIILTILLVIYNSYSKKIRRNSFDFVLNNPWIKLTFTIFGCSLIFIFLSLVAVNSITENSKITLLYFCNLITFFSLLCQFPLVILSLKHSNSFQTIRKLIADVNEEDVRNVLNPTVIPQEEFVEAMEKNRIIQLKDLAVFAIKENDWGMPQTILNGLQKKLIYTINDNTSNAIPNIQAFIFVCNHLKNITVEEADIITARVMFNILQNIPRHLAKERMRDVIHTQLDEITVDFFRQISTNSNFYGLQPYLVKSAISIIENHINSISYTDEELPTLDYSSENFGNVNNDSSRKVMLYWYYIKGDILNILFKTLEHAIESGNKNVYDGYNFQLQMFLNTISDSKNLTESQANELFDAVSYKIRRISDFAIQNNIYHDIDFYSSSQMIKWIIEKKKYSIISLYEYSYFLKHISKNHNVEGYYIDNFFMIARSLSSQDIDLKIKTTVIEIILSESFIIFDSEEYSKYVKEEYKKQFKWLYVILKSQSDLNIIIEKFGSRIESIEGNT